VTYIDSLSSSSPAPYCAQYNYPAGSAGIGCAPYTSYTKTVALTLNSKDTGGPLFTSNSSSSSVPSATSSPPSSNNSGSSHKLSAGAIAGIAIGSIAGLTLIILVVILLLQHRRKAQQTNESVPAPAASPPTQQIGFSPVRVGSKSHRPYMGPTTSELDTNRAQSPDSQGYQSPGSRTYQSSLTAVEEPPRLVSDGLHF
jgi:hypothetical protein